MEISIIDRNTTLAYNHEYVVTAFNDTTLTLPQGKAGQIIKISAQELNEGQRIKIQPYEGNTIGNENELYLDVSYSSVELICAGTDWKIVTPFAPMTNTMLESTATTISGDDTLSLLQNGQWKAMTLNQLKTFLGLTV